MTAAQRRQHKTEVLHIGLSYVLDLLEDIGHDLIDEHFRPEDDPVLHDEAEA